MPIIQPWFQGWGDLSLYICWICGLVCVCVSDCVCVILLLVFVKVLVFEFVPMCQQPLLTGCPCCLSSVSTVSRLPSTHTDMQCAMHTSLRREHKHTDYCKMMPNCHQHLWGSCKMSSPPPPAPGQCHLHNVLDNVHIQSSNQSWRCDPGRNTVREIQPLGRWRTFCRKIKAFMWFTSSVN